MISTLGSLSIGALVFLLMATYVEPQLARPWVRHRLALLTPNSGASQASVNSSNVVPAKHVDPGALAALLDTVMREMHAGSSLNHALVRAAESHPDLASFTEPIVLCCMRGLDVAHAIDEINKRDWTVDMRHAAQTLALAAISNSPVVVQHGASVIRERVALAAECATRSAQAQASLRILTWAPLIISLLIVFISSDARQFLFASAFGIGCLAVGAVFQFVARQWMTHLINEATP